MNEPLSKAPTSPISHLLKSLNLSTKQLKDLNEEYKITSSAWKSHRKSQIENHGQPLSQISKTIEKEYHHCQELCEKRMNITNDAYFLIETEWRKINTIIESLELEEQSNNFSKFSYQNYLIEKNMDDILKLYNYLNSKKKSKNKTTKTFWKHSLIKLGSISSDVWKSKQEKAKAKGVWTNKVSSKKYCDNKDMNDLEDITYRAIDWEIGGKEQLYCFCNYISYGNMIKCDNIWCKKEWFHFHCVGWRSLPKGKWFCSEKCFNDHMMRKD